MSLAAPSPVAAIAPAFAQMKKLLFQPFTMESLLESGAILDVLRKRRLADPTRCRSGRQYLIRLAGMLSKLSKTQL